MWWFFLSLVFGGSPVAWVISVGLFSGCLAGFWLLYHLERESNRK